MMRILVFQHLAVEHPGVFRDLWAARGDQYRAVELDAGEPVPDLDGFDLLVAMGGPMDVWQEDLHPWLVAEKAAIATWVRDLGRPYLGVCLGHQLLAAALGGEVGLMARPEVGLAEVELTPEGRADPLFAGLPDRCLTFQWHGAEIRRLPPGGVVLAGNAACPVQAIRWGRHAYGVQYHVEITPRTVPDWQAIPEYAASLQAALGVDGAARLEGDVAERLPAFGAAAWRLDANLTAIVGGG
ncbi:type 1 glutamine amidotransferase [Rhodovastum atsumiense]|nr:type 1 glutamine amidotransferase [Rhodovastum atsumiense]